MPARTRAHAAMINAAARSSSWSRRAAIRASMFVAAPRAGGAATLPWPRLIARRISRWLPPQVHGVAVVVPVVHDAVKLLVQIGMPQRCRQSSAASISAWIAFQPRDVVIGADADEPAGQIGLDQRLDLIDVAHESLVDPAAPGRRGSARSPPAPRRAAAATPRAPDWCWCCSARPESGP